MLEITRKSGDSFLIHPSLDVDPHMTIAELFRVGPIRVFVDQIAHKQVNVSIQAPKVLQIARSELETA